MYVHLTIYLFIIIIQSILLINTNHQNQILNRRLIDVIAKNQKKMCTYINNHLHFSLYQVIPNDKWFYLLTLGIFGVYIVIRRKGNYMITQLNIEIKTS